MSPRSVALQRCHVTSFDVAAEARVSQSTVSKALRGEKGVRCETRLRVIDAAASLGYYVDVRASRLRRLKSECVAVIAVCERLEEFAEEGCNALSLLPELQGIISSLGYEMLLSIQSPLDPQDSFVRSGRAEASIVIGLPDAISGWRAQLVRPPAKKIAFSGFQNGNWEFRDSFECWLREAVRIGNLACEIVITNTCQKKLKEINHDH